MSIWVLLMLFGVVTWVNPKWLQELSEAGIRVEARDYKDYGDDLLRQKNYPLAIAQYERSLQIQPDQVGILVNLALAYSRAGNVARGIAILQDALPKAETDANKTALHYNLGDLLARQGKTDEALEHYDQALKSPVRPDQVHHRIGVLYRTAGRYAEARKAFELALAEQLDPCLSYRGMLLRDRASYKDDDVHLPVIEQELARDLKAEDLTRYDLEVIRRMQATDLKIADTHDQLAMVCTQLGDIPAAIEHLEKLLQIMPDSAAARQNLARLQRSLQQKP
jgi:tetratricopeptide (TPR) repeat protein